MEKILREILTKALTSSKSENGGVEIEIPKEEGFGDLSTPVAMGLAKQLKKPPRKIAEDIVNAIKNEDIFERIEIAGPGFINFTFTKKFLCNELKKLLKEKDGFIREDIGKGKRVQIEFVSANPTGPLHLGHGRGAALGAALSNLLNEAGFRVKREFYINDAGRQVRLLGLSVFARYKQLSGIEHQFPEDGYRGDYIAELAMDFKAGQETDGAVGTDLKSVPVPAGDTELLEKITDFSYKKMLELIKTDLGDFGVFFDTWQSEKDLYESGEVLKAINDLKARGYIYEQDGATWFKSTDFGDDKDRVIIKKDGDLTYFAPDIAYHRNKLEKGFDEIIDIWGADHHGYIPRMQAVMQALGSSKDRFRVLLVQIVSLLKGGQPVQMSKRAGNFIALREVIDDIGPDTTKFLFLTRRSDSHLEIDIEVAKAQSSENPVFYVQYANARINSIFEKAKESGQLSTTDTTPCFPLNKGGIKGGCADFNGELLNDEEMGIIKKLLLYPMMFRNAALLHEPHRITFYLQELAGMFHPYYHKYKVISEDPELTVARLALCEAIGIVLRHGLKMLGVKAPERM